MEYKCSHRNCIQIFIVALFIIDKLWKQARCPLLGEWINKFWAIQTMEYYSALKGNELSSHEKAWRKLNGILLSERNESGKTTYRTSPSIWHSGKHETLLTIKESVIAWVSLEGGIHMCSTADFYSTKITHYDTIMVDSCHYNLPKPIEYTSTIVNFNVNYGLWLIMVYQYRLIDCNKCTILIQYFGSKGMWGHGH